MSFELKFNKYNFKYLSLQKQIGGLNLSGPATIDYYKNDTKKIIILGEFHGNKEGVCEDKKDTLEINKYIETLFDPKVNIKFDVFIEKTIPHKWNLINNNIITDYNDDSEYILMIRNLLIKNYKINENKKVHFTDIRNKLLGFEQFVEIKNSLNLLQHVEKLKDDWNLLNLFNSYYNVTLIILLSQIEQFIKNNEYVFTNHINLPDYLIKEMNKLQDKILLKKLLIILQQKINEYIDAIDINEKSIQYNLSNLNDLGKLFIMGMDVSTYVNDLYTVLRIIKNDDIKNCIIYAGEAHLISLNEYLNVCGFNLITQKHNTPENFRCVKDVIPFDVFFNT
jgi:hypothetical protein